MIECPSVYELMAWAHFNWSVLPELRLWHIHADKDGNEKVVMEAYGPNSYVDVMSAALEENMVFTCFPTLFLMKCLMLRAQFSKARSRNLSFS
jgi:hypothetical protein